MPGQKVRERQQLLCGFKSERKYTFEKLCIDFSRAFSQQQAQAPWPSDAPACV